MNLGMTRADFIAEYFEKQFFSRKEVFADHGVAWQHINDALFSWDPRNGLIRLFKDGPVPLEQYTEPFVDIGMQRLRIVKDIFYAHLRTGATLVLDRIDTQSPLIQRMTMEIARFVGERAVANGYVAFGGQGTFAKHWDTHDVFAVQLIGRKHWKVFTPTFALPLPHQTSKRYKHECPAEPVFDGILEAGDVLYIPRGWWHEAIPLDSQETCHIAVGIHTAHVVDYFSWSCSNALAHILDFRRTLKFEDNHHKIIQDALAYLQEVLLSPHNIQTFKEALIEQERVVSPFHIEKFGSNKSKEAHRASGIILNSAYDVNVSNCIKANGISVNFDNKFPEIIERINCDKYNAIKNKSLSDNKLENILFNLIKNDIATFP